MPDILIRGMEMPHDCSRCSVKVDPDTRQCCVDKHLFEETLSVLISRRDKDCPLHELPLHGDLIDRDALLNRINAYVCGSQDSEFIKNEIIKAMPAIVPAERRESSE